MTSILEQLKDSVSQALVSAFGEEFLPLISKVNLNEIFILEPSEQLKGPLLSGIQSQYIKPSVEGSIPFENETFDVITCFGTLHHIPNVSFVFSEMIRVLKPNGYIFLREPINTMGDWRYPRKGLTANERGIPVDFFDKIIKENRITIINKSFCECIFIYKIFQKFGINNFNKFFYKIDKIASNLLKWNVKYHRTSVINKIAPGSIFYVLKK